MTYYTVTYTRGNGSGGGKVPVDPGQYQQGNAITIAENTGKLTRSGAVFFYWADASNGTIYTPGEQTKFPYNNNLVLNAQWGITTSLNGGGVTTHYAFYYDESLNIPAGVEPARTNDVIQYCEDDFNWLQGLFGHNVHISKVEKLPIQIYVMSHHGSGFRAGWAFNKPMHLNASNSAPSTLLRSLMVEEVSEMFMRAQRGGWGFSKDVPDEGSCGEGLSIFLGEQFQLQILRTNITPGQNPSDNWLNSSLPKGNPKSTRRMGTTFYGPRKDYINKTLGFPGNGPGTGCSLLFIYFLFHQLGFTISKIIQAAPGLNDKNELKGKHSACLRSVYFKLTGDDTDPFPCFAQRLAAAYPKSEVAAIPGPNWNDPWPLYKQVRVPGSDTDSPPALAGNDGTYYVAWKDPDGAIYVSVGTTTADATGGFGQWTFTWGNRAQIQGPGWSALTNRAPSLAVQSDTLYAAWTDRSTRKIMYSSSSDGVTWTKQAEVPGAHTGFAPSLHLASGAPPIVAAWTGEEDSIIKYTWFPGPNGGWGPIFSIGETTDDAPSVGSSGAGDFTLVFVWREPGFSNQLMFKTDSGGTAQKILGAASTVSASVSDTGMAWKGDVGHSSNIWVTGISFNWYPPPKGRIPSRELLCYRTDVAPAWLDGALAYKAVTGKGETSAPIFTVLP